MSQEKGDEPSALPPDVQSALAEYGVDSNDEVKLRQLLERFAPTYNLFRLSPAAARRWKCRYRILIEAGYCDGMSVAEAYARALLLLLSKGDTPTSLRRSDGTDQSGPGRLLPS